MVRLRWPELEEVVDLEARGVDLPTMGRSKEDA